MPHTPVKPPTKRVEELTSKITKDIWESFDGELSLTVNDREKRGIKMIIFLTKELAIERAKNEILSK